MANNYFVICPRCGKENSVESVYLESDKGTYLHCKFCKKFFFTSIADNPYKKPSDSVAYKKEAD